MKEFLINLLFACAFVSQTACVNAQLTVGDEELKRFPLRTDLPGDPSANGLRYWGGAFKPLKANGAYVSVIIRNGQYELWRGSLVFKGTNTQGRLAPNYQKAQVDERVCIVSPRP